MPNKSISRDLIAKLLDEEREKKHHKVERLESRVEAALRGKDYVGTARLCLELHAITSGD